MSTLKFGITRGIAQHRTMRPLLHHAILAPLCQIYVRTCRVRNGCRTGHADVLCNYFLIDASVLQRDRPAPGACAQRGPSRSCR